MTQNSNTTDKQQALNTLKQHGGNIVMVIAIALAGFFGWQFYQNNYAKVDTVAADSYTLIGEKNDELATKQQGTLDETAKAELAKEQEALFADIDKLVETHGETAYAWQALMIKARQQTDSGDYAGAVDTLKKAQAINLDDEGLSAITTLRLAHAQLANGEADEALSLANGALPKAFEPSRQELLGDIYVSKNDTDNAKKAYEQAWQALTERGNGRSLLSLKMQALGLNPTPIQPKNVVVAQAPQAQPAQEAQPSQEVQTGDEAKGMNDSANPTETSNQEEKTDDNN